MSQAAVFGGFALLANKWSGATPIRMEQAMLCNIPCDLHVSYKLGAFTASVGADNILNCWFELPLGGVNLDDSDWHVDEQIVLLTDGGALGAFQPMSQIPGQKAPPAQFKPGDTSSPDSSGDFAHRETLTPGWRRTGSQGPSSGTSGFSAI